MTARLDLLWVFWEMYTSQTAASVLIRHLFWFFGALWWQICMIIHILWTSGHIKLADISKWSQEWIYYRYSGICIPLKQLEVPPQFFFFFFFCVFGALDDKISQVSISWELYILKWLTFKMTKNDHSITVEHTWGCEVRLHNSRIGNFFSQKIGNNFWKTANWNFQFARKFWINLFWW